MKKIILLSSIIVFAISLLAESPSTNEQLDESSTKQHTFSGSSLASRDEMIKFGSPFEAKLMVEDGIIHMRDNDFETAFKDFKKKEGRFHLKDLYLFVIDMDGNVLCHGGEQALNGKNMIDLKDSAGNYFVKDFIELMQETENGWKEYYWRNYETQKVEMKLTYLKRYNENIFVGCGAYQPRY